MCELLVITCKSPLSASMSEQNPPYLGTRQKLKGTDLKDLAGVDISIHLARSCSFVSGFYEQNNCLVMCLAMSDGLVSLVHLWYVQHQWATLPYMSICFQGHIVRSCRQSDQNCFVSTCFSIFEKKNLFTAYIETHKQNNSVLIWWKSDPDSDNV